MTKRSPIPAGPKADSPLAPRSGKSRQPSRKPAAKIAALRLSPPREPAFFRPSTKPQARATTFLNAPHNSAPTGSVAGTRLKVGVDKVEERRSATERSWLATWAMVSTPRATSGAMVGPVITATALPIPAAINFSEITCEIERLPSANPLARSRSTCDGRRWGIKSSTTSRITEDGNASTTTSHSSMTSPNCMVEVSPSSVTPARYFWLTISMVTDSCTSCSIVHPLTW